jgi:hypothetical protein
LNKLARMLCIEFPAQVTQGIISILDKRDEENVDFDEFLQSIKTILLYDNFFEELETLFRHLDAQKLGRIKIEEFQEACQKLANETSDLRVPPSTDVETIYNRMQSSGLIESPGSLSQAEYQILLFKSTIDDFE